MRRSWNRQRRGYGAGPWRRVLQARSWRSLAVGLIAVAVYAAVRTLGERTGSPPRVAPERIDSPAAPSALMREEVAVERAIDGDTAVLEDGRSVRYAGIDAPEAGEPGYEEAREANRQLVSGRRVRLEVAAAEAEAADRYGRVLAVVKLAGVDTNLSVNASLVRDGHAWVYQATPDALAPRLLSELLAAQGSAIARRAGVWKSLDATSASRDLVSTRLRIHRASCPKLEDARPRPVARLETELGFGKSPCRECKPLSRFSNRSP